MFVVARTIEIRDGKEMPAVEHALKIASYLKESLDWDVQVMRNVSGQLNQIHWVVNFESMAEYEAESNRAVGDETLGQMIAEGGEMELYHGNTARDSFFRTIP